MRKGSFSDRGGRVRWMGEYNRETYNCEIVDLQEYGFLSTKPAEAHYCPGCRIVIVPVPAFEHPLEKLDRKWNEVTSRFAEKRKELEQEQEERAREKRREKRRKKDPWEID